MYSVTVRDRMMIAHSFSGEVFGPARQLHGATYVVDATFRRARLDRDGLVVDIARATQVLQGALADLNHRNLDEHPALAGCNTTTERLAGVVFERLAAAVREGELGDSGRDLQSICVTLHESDIAWASFDGDPAQTTAEAEH